MVDAGTDQKRDEACELELLEDKLKDVEAKLEREVETAEQMSRSANRKITARVKQLTLSVDDMHKAMEDREQKQEAASAAIMNMFIAKTVCTMLAWLLQDLCMGILGLALGPSGSKLDASLIYASCIGVVVPVLQDIMGRRKGGQPYRLACCIDLQKNALPMIMAWANKIVIASVLDIWSDSVLVLPSVIAALVLTLVVSVLHNIPAVERAHTRRKMNEHGVVLRYLCWPWSLLLSVGFCYNNIVKQAVQEIMLLFLDSYGPKAASVLYPLLQITYFYFVAMAVSKLVALWTQKQMMLQKAQEEAESGILEHTELKVVALNFIEFEEDLGETMSSALGFVYAWGLMDTLQAIFFGFFLGLPCLPSPSPSYEQSWAFALLCMWILTRGSWLNVPTKSSAEHDAHKKLLINALSLALGWAIKSACSITSAFFISDIVTSSAVDYGEAMIVFDLAVYMFVLLSGTEIIFHQRVGNHNQALSKPKGSETEQSRNCVEI